MNLTTTYLGLDLANPIVASSSPLTREVESLERLQEAGAAAVVLPSLFEEQIEHEAMAVHEALDFGSEISPESVGGYFPEMDDYNTGAGDYLDRLRLAKETLTIPVIASLNGDSAGGWTLYARIIEDAGADALELNIYLIAADMERTGVEVEDDYLRLVGKVREAVSIPLAVKVGPYFSSTANMARRLVDAGADGLVLFNRFYQPDIDLDTLTVGPNLVLSSSAELRLVLRWMAILHGRIDGSLGATTGVHTAEDVVKLILSGADVAMMASALLQNGPGHIRTVLGGVEKWFADRDYQSIAQAKGSLSQRSSPDPSAFERSNYMHALIEYSSRH
ncbi:MAG: dihydroorotate dehydrogenase-like protein [Acidimicrobiia bacterium]|nr:dihydroorotate dehydrogenase-like protein [Acidimicrobiia bacterium]NNL69444.1 dihydroorotate dehydrogenase-like protein [Acidimicrobiia bacterium]